MTPTSAEWLGLAGNRALVLGAGGLGGAIAVALADAGCHTTVADRTGGSAAALAERSAVEGFLEFDAREHTSCEEVVEAAAALHGGLDLMIHAVGVNVRDTIDQVTATDVQQIALVNAASVLWTMRSVVRTMALGGTVVVLTSASAHIARPGHAVYSASKAAVERLVAVAALEWAPRSIRVNAVAPSYVETELTRAHLAQAGVKAALIERLPARPLSSFGDVVDSVLFLASARSSFMTGQTLLLDGGESLA